MPADTPFAFPALLLCGNCLAAVRQLDWLLALAHAPQNAACRYAILLEAFRPRSAVHEMWCNFRLNLRLNASDSRPWCGRLAVTERPVSLRVVDVHLITSQQGLSSVDASLSASMVSSWCSEAARRQKNALPPLLLVRLPARWLRHAPLRRCLFAMTRTIKTLRMTKKALPCETRLGSFYSGDAIATGARS